MLKSTNDHGVLFYFEAPVCSLRSYSHLRVQGRILYVCPFFRQNVSNNIELPFKASQVTPSLHGQNSFDLPQLGSFPSRRREAAHGGSLPADFIHQRRMIFASLSLSKTGCNLVPRRTQSRKTHSYRMLQTFPYRDPYLLRRYLDPPCLCKHVSNRLFNLYVDQG